MGGFVFCPRPVMVTITFTMSNPIRTVLNQASVPTGHRSRHLPDRRAPRGGLRVRARGPDAGGRAAADGGAGQGPIQ